MLDSLSYDDSSYGDLFNLIEDFSIEVSINMMRAEVKEIEDAKDKPRMDINAKIPEINIKIDKVRFDDLTKIGECFAVAENE